MTWRTCFFAAVANGILVAVAGSALAQKAPAEQGKDAARVVTVGSKRFTENVILGEMITHLARHSGAKVRHRSDLGGTPIVFQSLEEGDIDVYAEYTGTLLSDVFGGQSVRTEQDLREALSSRGIRMTERLGFNNAYALGMKEEMAERLGITRISQLATHPQLKFGFSEEFINRPDGWGGVARRYGLEHRPGTMDHDLAYRGLDQGSLDVTDLFSTDAEIRLYKLRLLEDDRGFFPQYHCVLLYRADLEERMPKVVAGIKRLELKLDNARMLELNTRANIDHVREARVAADFLGEALDVHVTLPESSLWADLARTTRAHLYLVLTSLSAATIVGIPLGIWSYKWPPLGHLILAVIGILQTLPSMALLVFMIPLFGLGPRPAIVALFLYSLLPIVRGTFSGLKEIPGNLKESAIVLGLSPRAKLWLVELPMASRSILSGIKTSAVINIGTATIGALINAGGYGEPILTGIRRAEVGLILQGAVPAAILALLVQAGFEALEPFLVPRGLRIVAAGKG